MASSSQNKDSKTSAGNDHGKKAAGKSGSKSQSDTSGRGFASMDPAQQKEISAEGGRAAHASGNAHEFTSDEAKKAGAKSHGSASGSTDGKGSQSSGGSRSK